jgi:hypothetical protein
MADPLDLSAGAVRGVTFAEAVGSAELGDEFLHGRRGGVERRLLLGRQLDLEDSFHPSGAKDDRHADKEVVRPELALE